MLQQAVADMRACSSGSGAHGEDVHAQHWQRVAGFVYPQQ